MFSCNDEVAWAMISISILIMIMVMIMMMLIMMLTLGIEIEVLSPKVGICKVGQKTSNE